MTDATVRLTCGVVSSQQAAGDREYRVEAIDAIGDGKVYAALFSGPDAKGRAVEYLANVWRFRDLLWSSLCEVKPFMPDSARMSRRETTARGDALPVLSRNGRGDAV